MEVVCEGVLKGWVGSEHVREEGGFSERTVRLCIAVCLLSLLPVQSPCCFACTREWGLDLGYWSAYPMGRRPGPHELSCPQATAELD